MDISCRLFKISVFSITTTLNEKHINLEKTTSSFLSVILINLWLIVIIIIFINHIETLDLDIYVGTVKLEYKYFIT